MANVYEIPTTSEPQTFAVSLSGVNYTLTLRWNTAAGLWFLDIATADGVAILSGVPLVTGADLLEQYAYLNLGGKMFCATDNNPDMPPAFATLGDSSHLYWIPN